MQTVGLPDGLASGLEAFRDLERFLSDAAVAHLGLSELERGSERRSRELVRLSLQAHVDSRGDGDVGEAIVVSGPDGPVRLAYKRRHTRSVLTLFGEVRIERVGYGAPGHAAFHPLDAELIHARKRSPPGRTAPKATTAIASSETLRPGRGDDPPRGNRPDATRAADPRCRDRARQSRTRSASRCVAKRRLG